MTIYVTPPYVPAPPQPSGWVCPRCGAVHAPWVPQCLRCSHAPTHAPTPTYEPYTITNDPFTKS